jgi:hypothetical protein
LLREAAMLHLARESWLRIDTLAPETRADLRTVVGYTTSQEDVLAQPGVRDLWNVMGRIIEETDEGLRVQRTWLFGKQSRRPALCLSFSAATSQPLDASLMPGSTVDAELAFFPSAWPLRAVVKLRHGTMENLTPDYPHASIADANTFAAEAFSANPWIERVPFAFAAVYPLPPAGGWILRDDAGDSLPLSLPEWKAWKLLALSGGHACKVAGEWDGENLRPLSVWSEGRFLAL